MTSKESSDNFAKLPDRGQRPETANDPGVAMTQMANGILLRVFVQPKARRAQLVGLHLDRLKIAVTEPPDRGKANAAVLRFTAELFQISKSSVTLFRGDTSRNKDLLLQDLSIEDAVSRLKISMASNQPRKA